MNKEKEYTKETFLKELDEKGYVIRESQFNSDFLERAKKALLICIDVEAEKAIGSKDYPEYGLLLCSAYFGNEYPVFFEFFENEYFLEPFEWVLDKWYITYIYSSACLRPGGGRLPTSNIHVDSPRFMPAYHFGLGAIICIDDFTKENGGTYLLPGSHKQEQKPDEDYFFKNAVRFEAPAGSVCYFNPRLWHAAGQNQTDEWRTSLNIGMGRPWMKQRIDIPSFLKDMDLDHLPERTKQLLGFYSIPPKKYEDYFASKEKRTFKQPFV